MVTVTPAERFRGDGGCAGAQMCEDGAQIEQRLGGMLVHAVAGVDDGQAGGLLKQPGCAGGVVAQDDGLGAERAQGEAGVFERLALLDAGAEAGNEGGVCAEDFGGELKAGAGARGRLVKEQRDAALGEDAVAEQRVLVFEGGGAGEDVADGVHAEVHDGEQRAGIVRERQSGRWRRMNAGGERGLRLDSCSACSFWLRQARARGFDKPGFSLGTSLEAHQD